MSKSDHSIAWIKAIYLSVIYLSIIYLSFVIYHLYVLNTEQQEIMDIDA